MKPSTLETLRRLETSLWQAESRFDDARMNQLFAADFVEFGRSGRTYTREEMLLAGKGYSEINATLPLRDFRARLLSDDIAQVMYISEVRYGDQIETANRSSIWSRQDTDWILRFHQGKPL